MNNPLPKDSCVEVIFVSRVNTNVNRSGTQIANMSKDTHVKKSFSFLLWKLWLILHYNKIPKETHVKKSFSFLLWKLWLTLPNKKIPKETHVKNSFSFLLWILWLTLDTLVTFATKLFNILKVENSHLSNNTKNCLGTDFTKKNNFS